MNKVFLIIATSIIVAALTTFIFFYSINKIWDIFLFLLIVIIINNLFLLILTGFIFANKPVIHPKDNTHIIIVTNKLFIGKSINRDLYMILEEGMSEISLINQTTTFIQQLFLINTYLKLNGQLNIIEIWGYKLPQNIANARASIAMRFKTDDFTQMLNFFSTLELELKTKSTLDINSYTQAQFRNFSASLR